MMDARDVALFVIAVGSAVAAVLMADAADEALRGVPEIERRRAALMQPASRIPPRVRAMAYHGVSWAFLGGVAISGALLIGALP